MDIIKTPDALDDFSRDTFTHDGLTRSVFTAGTGPVVIVIHEMPGLTPEVATFARRVVSAGFTVVMPSLFGTPGKPVSVPYIASSLSRACVAKEFAAFATNRTQPVIGWLRALAARSLERHGGPGVGVVGMCFTGGFALAMMVDDTVLAPVLSQPSAPLGFSKKAKAALNTSPEDLDRVKERIAQGACLMGLRFTNDMAVPKERFETLRRELGDGFLAIEIDSSRGNAHGIPRSAHSVLTMHFVDEPGHPTREALDRVLAFFAEQLRPAADSSPDDALNTRG